MDTIIKLKPIDKKILMVINSQEVQKFQKQEKDVENDEKDDFDTGDIPPFIPDLKNRKFIRNLKKLGSFEESLELRPSRVRESKLERRARLRTLTRINEEELDFVGGGEQIIFDENIRFESDNDDEEFSEPRSNPENEDDDDDDDIIDVD